MSWGGARELGFQRSAVSYQLMKAFKFIVVKKLTAES